MLTNALKHRDKLKIACAVSLMDEFTLDLCVDRLKAQTIPFDAFQVVGGKSPMCASFNACLDFAWDNGCDLLFHTAADVMAEPFALEKLLEIMDVDEHYLSVGRGFDIVNGCKAPVGLWVFNLRILSNKHRFRDEFLQDLKLCERIEADTKKTRTVSDPLIELGYHHPIWTPRDIYMKYRYSTRKYKEEIIQRYIRFFHHELGWNPDNKVLQIGLDSIFRSLNSTDNLKSKDHHALEQEWDHIKGSYNLDGTEYYVYNYEYKDIARNLLKSEHNCVTVEEREILPTQQDILLLSRNLKKQNDFIDKTQPKKLADKYRRKRQSRLEFLSENLGLFYPPSQNDSEVRVPAVPTETLVRSPYRYGSKTRGVETWEKKWDKSPGKRILFFAFKDFGSFYKWAGAVNRYTPYAARMVCISKHQYGLPCDLSYPSKNYSFDLDGILSLMNEADVIHIKDEYLFYISSIKHMHEDSGYVPIAGELFKKFSKKPMIFTQYGGYARKFEGESAYRKFVLDNFAARIALTPDLNYEWFNGYFIPQSVDIHEYPYLWQNGKTLMHTPSTSARKGTDILHQAILRMEHEIDYDLIQNVSHQECLAHKTRATLFFDQAGREVKSRLGIDDVIGWYGNNAVESMVYGVPTIAHISERALEGAHRAGKDMSQCPIIRVGTDEESIYRAIKGFFDLTPTQRKKISQKTRAWTENFHSFEVNAQELAGVYDKILKK